MFWCRFLTLFELGSVIRVLVLERLKGRGLRLLVCFKPLKLSSSLLGVHFGLGSVCRGEFDKIVWDFWWMCLIWIG